MLFIRFNRDPVKADKNTFWALEQHDQGGYMSRYTFQDSLEMKLALPYILNQV
jgi:hypothetical protein